VISGSAICATPAADGRRNDDPVSFAQIAHGFASLLHDAYGFMAENAAFLYARKGPADKVQIGSADRAGCNANDCVGWLLDFRFRNGFESDVADATKDNGFHRVSPGREWRGLDVRPMRAIASDAGSIAIGDLECRRWTAWAKDVSMKRRCTSAGTTNSAMRSMKPLEIAVDGCQRAREFEGPDSIFS
jgi:hypothetical protein